MSNNINWMDNKVVNPSVPTPRQTGRTTYSTPSDTSLKRPMPETELPRTEPPYQADPMQRTEPFMNGTMPFMQGPPPSTEKGYIPHFLASNMGKLVRAEFIIGTSQYFDKVGRIVEVGINYFVLDDVYFNQLVMCDLYSVKFVTILRS